MGQEGVTRPRAPAFNHILIATQACLKCSRAYLGFNLGFNRGFGVDRLLHKVVQDMLLSSKSLSIEKDGAKPPDPAAHVH